MDGGFTELDDRQLLAVIEDALDALTDDRLRLPTDAERMGLLLASLRASDRLRAWQQRQAAAVEVCEAAWHEHKTSATTWLAQAANLTPNEARRLIKAGQELARFGTVEQAAAAGRVSPAQAEAISSVLAQLPDDFDAETIDQAQELMVGFAADHNSAELRRLTSHLVEVLAPEAAERLDAERLERQLAAARRNRFLEFHPDGQGSMLFRGSLPVHEAEPFLRIIDAYALAAKRGIDRLDPLAEYLSTPMARADALIAMAHHHSQQALAPGNGGDRPRLVITMSYDKLVKTAQDAGLVDDAGVIVATGQPVAPSVIRQLLCDAELMPLVLGGPSLPLDVGDTQRLATPGIRAALSARDGGCVFPGCDTVPALCHAHHLQPWRWDGPTALSNLVLLCPHHHGICEPDPGGGNPNERWQVRLRDSGIPEIIPPTRVDPSQRPRLHARFRSHVGTGEP